jgi:O-antigen polymerase
LPKLFTLLTSLTIGVSLINSVYFGSPAMAAYFLYVIVASILVFSTGIILSKSNNSIKVILNPATGLFILLTVYYSLHGILNQDEGLNMRHIFLITNCLLLISYCVLLKEKMLNAFTIYKVIALLAIIESVICILQATGLIRSNNPFFRVTGSWANPNVTAMFLIMALPAVWGILSPKKIYKSLSIAVVCLLTIAIALLKCRTAFIGMVIEALVIAIFHYRVLEFIREKYSVLIKSLLVVLGSVIIVFSSVYLYQSKQASADGRKLIWKVSLGMVVEKPLLGYGYGMFERDYNLAQAKYFETKAATEKEIANASFVHMAYSELMENAVEGGIIGSLFFMGFITSLLIRKVNDKQVSKKEFALNELSSEAAYTGIAAFAVMSIFNFTVQAIPVMGLFIFYVALRVSEIDFKKIESKQVRQIKSFAINPFAALFIIASSIICISQVKLVQGHLKEKEASLLLKEHNTTEAVQLFKSQENSLKHYSNFWIHYTSALFIDKQYSEAVLKLREATKYTSDPDLFILSGNIYCMLQEYDKAKVAYTTAGNIQPNRFMPRYALMKMYFYTKDSVNAIKAANQLITLNPKIESEKIDYYKKEANWVIQQCTFKKADNLKMP